MLVQYQKSHRMLDVLFVSQWPCWPLDQGFRLRGYHMARELTKLGLCVGVSSMLPASVNAASDLRELLLPWPEASDGQTQAFERAWRGPMRKLRDRVASHQGLEVAGMAGVLELVARHRPSAVVALGQHGPMLLRGLRDLKNLARVWYAGDDLINFQLSCMARESPRAWGQRWRPMVTGAAIETLFAQGIDGVIGVAPHDTRMLRALTLARHGLTLRNGVDLSYFRPQSWAVTSGANKSVIFWGRMDFEPNVDAVRWFAQNVWPELRRTNPQSTWKILGKKPVEAIRALGSWPGVSVMGEVTDLRPHALQSSVVILPMQRGAGIKNKLLEAAAMGKPILASSTAIRGLSMDPSLRPGLVCDQATDWIQSVRRIWSDAALAHQLGAQARQWACIHHDWTRVARTMADWLEHLSAGRCTTDVVAAEIEEFEELIEPEMEVIPFEDDHDVITTIDYDRSVLREAA